MNVSAPFIRRPVATTLLTLALALAGILAFHLLPVASLPQVEFPTIQVQAALPGASPETMASAVATPLERQFGRIAGVTELTSTSNLGSTSITLQFDLGRSIDAAARDVQAAINAARADLPANLPGNPTYRKVNPADAPILILSLTSETLDPGRLYDLAASVLQQKLAQVEGVGQVTSGGGALPGVRVALNPMALNKYGIGLEQVRSAIAAANVNRPKGDLADASTTWTITTTDQILKASAYRSLVIATRRGAAVRLEDVADVEDSVENVRAGGLANGKPAALLILFRQPGANVIQTVDRVLSMMPQLRAALPPAADLQVMLDRTTTIRSSIDDVERALVISIALVIGVVFVFLRDPRTTLIPSVAVPLSLIGTFGVMYLFGYSIDNLSMMALTICTGFVVDDAIVVIENISRYLEQGMAPFPAALRGSREIGFTVLSMSTSLIAVFLPILLMGGIVGRLFREFAVTLSAAILVSLVVSLTATPMMCARLLRSSADRRHGPVDRAGEHAFEAVKALYARGLRWVLAHAPLTLAVVLLTMALNVYLFSIIPKGFFPQQDVGRLTGSILAAQDMSYQGMRERLTKLVGIMRSDPAVVNVVAFTGGNDGATNAARLFATLTPIRERRTGADAIISRLRPTLAGVPGASLFLQPVQDLRIGGRPSASQFQFSLRSESLELLAEWTPKMLDRLRAMPFLVDVTSDQQDRGLESQVVIDRDTASRLGVTAQAVDETLYDAFGQRQVSTMYTQANQYHVVLEVAPRFRESPESLGSIYVRSASGAQIPLSAFTRIEPRSAP
ncbi:MAG: efflux RND transporter permease subunit, partial [Acidobacteria bacterium]|nr:efflux RND transporter permease subunit [Acidobacteriota bacterium]